MRVALWNIYQELQISNLRAQQRGIESAATGRHEGLREQVWRLEDRVERLLIVNEAMWELCSERLGITEEELSARAAAIDGRDGTMDGRRPRPQRRCGACDAVVPSTRPTCAFCGAPAPGGGTAHDQV